MEKKYVTPEMEIIEFETEDIIITSSGGPGGEQQGNDVDDP